MSWFDRPVMSISILRVFAFRVTANQTLVAFVVSFTSGKSTGDLKAVPLQYKSKKGLLIPTDYVMHAKVDVSVDISK